MKIEKLQWMLEQLNALTSVTEEMLADIKGHTPEPEAFETQDQTNPVLEPQGISYQELQALGLTLNNLAGRDALVEWMRRLGIESLKKLRPENYGFAMAEGSTLLEEIRAQGGAAK